MVEGLAQTSENYGEAVACLQNQYDHLRLIHQAHVCTVVNPPPLKDVSGKELRHLHEIINQHIRVITAMADNSLEVFVTSIIELKLGQASMFAWKNYSHKSRGGHPYKTLLEFLDRRARATENTICEREWKHLGAAPEGRISTKLSYIANVEETCKAWESAKHPLYGCKAPKGCPHSQKLELVREKNFVLIV